MPNPSLDNKKPTPPYTFKERFLHDVCYVDVYDTTGKLVAQGETGLTAPGGRDSDFIEARDGAMRQAQLSLAQLDPNWEQAISDKV